MQKPFALNIFPVPSKVTAKGLDIKIGGDVVAMPALKKAYLEDGIIFRLFNNSSRAEESYLEVNGTRLELFFGKFEVKTVIYENGILRESYEMLV